MATISRTMISRTKLSSFWRRAVRRLAYLILDIDVEGAEIVVILAAVAWGTLLSLPQGTFDSYPAYRQMRLFVPKEVWALTISALAFWQILALLYHSRCWRRRGLLVGAGLWMGVAVLIFRATPHSLMWSLCAILCAASSWAFWRIRREERLTVIVMEAVAAKNVTAKGVAADEHSAEGHPTEHTSGPPQNAPRNVSRLVGRFRG